MVNDLYYNSKRFEFDVAQFIINRCGNNEVFQPFLFNQAPNKPFPADGYLPSGCKALNLAPKTIIEIKYKILPDTINRWVRKIQDSFDADPDYNFVMIHKSRLIKSDWELNISGYKISIISFEELERRGSKAVNIKDDIAASYKEKVKEAIKKDSEDAPGREELLTILSTAAKNKNITLFLGAGVSVSGGLPSWDDLLKNLAQEINPEMNPSILSPTHLEKIKGVTNHSSIIMARYMRVGKDQPPIKPKPLVTTLFNDALHKALYGGRSNYEFKSLIDSLMWLICNKTVKAVITYNFDDYLETVLDNKNIPYQSIANGGRLDAGRFPIYHVHGLLPLNTNNTHIPNPVLTEEAYHGLYQDAYQWSNVEQLHALNNTTCVFIGLSMTDPNIRRLMEISMMKNETDDKIAPHFVFLRKPKFFEDRDNHSNDSSAKEDEEHIRIMEKMLHELGANIIWYDNHDDLPDLLFKL